MASGWIEPNVAVNSCVFASSFLLAGLDGLDGLTLSRLLVASPSIQSRPGTASHPPLPRPPRWRPPRPPSTPPPLPPSPPPLLPPALLLRPPLPHRIPIHSGTTTPRPASARARSSKTRNRPQAADRRGVARALHSSHSLRVSAWSSHSELFVFCVPPLLRPSPSSHSRPAPSTGTSLSALNFSNATDTSPPICI